MCSIRIPHLAFLNWSLGWVLVPMDWSTWRDAFSCIFKKQRPCCILTWTSPVFACGPNMVIEVWGFFTALLLWSRCPSHFSGSRHQTSFSYHVSLCKPHLQCSADWFLCCPSPNVGRVQRCSISRASKLLRSNKGGRIASVLKKITVYPYVCSHFKMEGLASCSNNSSIIQK